MTDWFADRGMPLDDTLRAHAGDDAFDDDSAMLEDPALEEFREWAGGAGQRWQLISYVRHVPFWSGLLGDRLDELLDYDYTDYDEFGVGARVGSPGLDGPRSSTQLAIWLAVAGAGLVLAAGSGTPAGTRRRRRHRRRGRPRSTCTSPSPATPWRCSATSFPRSPACRSPSCWPSGWGSRPSPTRRRRGATTTPPMRSRGRSSGRGRRSSPVVGLATTVLATTVVVAAFFGNELRAQDYDPQFMKVLIDRVGALGVTYYEGALHNKGPFEPFVYRAASFLTSDDGFWFAISAFVLVAAALCGRRGDVDGARRGHVTARRRGGRRRPVRPPHAARGPTTRACSTAATSRPPSWRPHGCSPSRRGRGRRPPGADS